MRLPDAFLKTPLAHRGLHDLGAGRVENSRSAFLAAIGHGYGVELDVQVSRDGSAMVFHDATLDRVTARRGPVRALDAAELGRIPLTGGEDRIELLDTILDLIGGRVPVLIEIKGPEGRSDDRLVRAVATALSGYSGPAAVMSFDPSLVEPMQVLAPDIPRGLTTCAFDAEAWDLSPQLRASLRDMAAYSKVGASFISHDIRDLDSLQVVARKNDGAAILCWTVRTPGAEATARAIADNVTFEGYLPAIPA